MQLNDIQQLNFASIKDNLCILAAGHPMSTIGEEMQMLSSAFQARAACHLLLDFDLQRFVTNLQRGAQARRYYLRKSGEQRSTDSIFTALSRTQSVFDCIVAGDWALAVQIENLSPSVWSPRGEYEEDFCYYKAIHSYLAASVQNGSLTTATAWRQRLETVVDEIPNSLIDGTRAALLRAFLDNEQGRFWGAFESLVELSSDQAAAIPLNDGRVFEFPWLAIDRFMSMELLAWIALAQNRGYRPPQAEYARCPSIAWIGLEAPPPLEDVFEEMEDRFHL